jgi:hypothetical protein
MDYATIPGLGRFHGQWFFNSVVTANQTPASILRSSGQDCGLMAELCSAKGNPFKRVKNNRIFITYESTAKRYRMISKWKKNAKKPSFSRALSLKLTVFECKVENFFHQMYLVKKGGREPIFPRIIETIPSNPKKLGFFRRVTYITSVRDNDEGIFLYTDSTDPAQDMRDFVLRILLLSFIEKIRVLQSNPVPVS